MSNNMNNNLLVGMESIPVDEQSKLLLNSLSLHDLVDIYQKLPDKTRSPMLYQVLEQLLNDKENNLYGISLKSLFLIHMNIINEFKQLDTTELYNKLPLYENKALHHIINSTFFYASTLISDDLSRGTLDLTLTETYEFYKDMFDFLENKNWDINFIIVGIPGIVNLYTTLEALNEEAVFNTYDEERQKKLTRCFEGIKILKDKILPLSLNSHLKLNEKDLYSSEDITNNKVSDFDKMVSLPELRFQFYPNHFLDDNIEDFKKNVQPKEALGYLSLYTTKIFSDSMVFTFDRGNPETKMFSKRLLSLIESHPQSVYFSASKDSENIVLALKFTNLNNKDLEVQVFKEFIHSLSTFLVNNQINTDFNPNLELKELLSGLDNSIKEVTLLSKLEESKKNNTSDLNPKKNKI